jgi:hypothetical protein
MSKTKEEEKIKGKFGMKDFGSGENVSPEIITVFKLCEQFEEQ